MSWQRAKRSLDIALVCLALVVAWLGLSWFVGTDILPGPCQTCRHLSASLPQPRVQRDPVATGNAHAIALCIAMARGLTLGILCGGWKIIGEEVEPVLLALIATPKV